MCTCESPPSHVFLIKAFNGSLSATHDIVHMRFSLRWLDLPKPLKSWKKKSSLRRRIAERTLQLAYKSFFNQSTFGESIQAQTQHYNQKLLQSVLLFLHSACQNFIFASLFSFFIIIHQKYKKNK